MVWTFRTHTVERLIEYIESGRTPYHHMLVDQVVACWPATFTGGVPITPEEGQTFKQRFMHLTGCSERGYNDLFVERKDEAGQPIPNDDITMAMAVRALNRFIIRAGDDTCFCRDGRWDLPHRAGAIRRTGVRALDLQPGVKVE